MFRISTLVMLLEGVLYTSCTALLTCFLCRIVLSFVPALSHLCFTPFAAITSILDDLRCVAKMYLCSSIGPPMLEGAPKIRPTETSIKVNCVLENFEEIAALCHALPSPLLLFGLKSDRNPLQCAVDGVRAESLANERKQPDRLARESCREGDAPRLTTAAGGSQTNNARTARESKGEGKQNAGRGAKKPAPNKKRRRNLHDGNEEDKDDDQSDPEDKGPESAEDEVGDTGLLLACPFYLFDPEWHYRCVGKYHLKTFKDVIGHLKRKHIQESHYCPLCWTGFKAAEDLSRHIQRRTCTPVPGPEELYGDDSETHLLETDPKLHPTGRYYQLWDNLFKGYPRPDSPYLKSGMAEPASVLCKWVRPQLQEKVTGLLHRHGIALEEDAVQELVRSFLQILSSVRSPPRRYRRHPPTPLSPGEAGQPMALPSVAAGHVAHTPHLVPVPVRTSYRKTPGGERTLPNNPATHFSNTTASLSCPTHPVTDQNPRQERNQQSHHDPMLFDPSTALSTLGPAHLHPGTVPTIFGTPSLESNMASSAVADHGRLEYPSPGLNPDEDPHVSVAPNISHSTSAGHSSADDLFFSGSSDKTSYSVDGFNFSEFMQPINSGDFEFLSPTSNQSAMEDGTTGNSAADP